jgi:hypothetical protein
MSESIGIDFVCGGGAMPRAYSADMRARVIGRVESGASRREAAEYYDRVKCFRETGPLGAFVFGWMGDRIGRKYTFLVTLTGMALGTGAIGLIPTFEQIGLAAAVILFCLRMIQGLCLGGQYGGAITYVAEHVLGRAPRLLYRLAADLADARHCAVADRHHRHACLGRR